MVITGLQAQVSRRGDGVSQSGSGTSGQQYGCIRTLSSPVTIDNRPPFTYSSPPGITSGSRWTSVAFDGNEYDPDGLSYSGGVKIKKKGRYRICIHLLTDDANGFDNPSNNNVNLVLNGSVDSYDFHGLAYGGNETLHHPSLPDGSQLVTWQDLNINDVLTVQSCGGVSTQTVRVVSGSSFSVMLEEELP